MGGKDETLPLYWVPGYGLAVSRAQHALQELKAAHEKDVAAHERNVPLLEANKAVRARVEALMDETAYAAFVAKL